MTNSVEGGRHELRQHAHPDSVGRELVRFDARLGELETEFWKYRNHAVGTITRLERWVMGALEDLQTQVAALVAEDGVVIAEIVKLQDRGDAVNAADVQSAADTIKAEVGKLAAVAGSVGSPPGGDTPAPPVTDPAATPTAGTDPGSPPSPLAPTPGPTTTG